MTERSFARRLDPRSKLAIQVAFVAAAYGHTRPVPLVFLTGFAIGCLWLSDLRVVGVLVELRYVLVLLGLAPLLAAFQIGSPWVNPMAGIEPALAAYRVLLLVAVGIALVRTTRPREARAAVRWLIPGRLGRVLGTGLGLVFRFLPLLRQELTCTRRAMRVRLASTRPTSERIGLLCIVVLVRLLHRSDRIARSLGVRCLSWNPTEPPIAFGRVDIPALGVAGALMGWAMM